ncbi:hypothetical protein GWI33_013217 [Rhynchophorus ferrugineus]|uniref:Protein Asterix n=1 Tax=Rhynchophorus ferrugineus TaxID=354439 RepID=A0A834I6X1_RHYFE|nr:hypothetical protein GWI33_013217 [Rhynchophorus ferrugineus]
MYGTFSIAKTYQRPVPIDDSRSVSIRQDFFSTLSSRLLFDFKGFAGEESPSSGHHEDSRLGMVFSMCGLMMRMKWCAWVALYCSCISFANSQVNDDTKQVLSSFMLSVSAIVMSYLQNPSPMSPPWVSSSD